MQRRRQSHKFLPLKCRHLQSAARGGRPSSPSLPAATGRITQKSYQQIFDEIFWRVVVCSLEEVNRLDNSTNFKAFDALDVSEKNYCLLVITEVLLHIHC